MDNDPIQYLKYGTKLSEIMLRKQERVYSEKLDLNNKTVVIWIFGPTGIGKTWSFYNDPWPNEKHPTLGPYSHDDRINVGNNRLDDFMKGYAGHKMVLMDDLRDDSISFNYLLTLLEKGKQYVKSFGKIALWVPEVIYITSPFSPN